MQEDGFVPKLAKLEEAGFVTRDVEKTSGRPDKKVFAITPTRDETIETKFPRDLENAKGGRFFGWATLNLGIDTTRARAKWCRSIARQLVPKAR